MRVWEAIWAELHMGLRERQAERRHEGLRRPAARWVVERTFSRFRRTRRLAKDFENLGETLVTFVALASIQLALRETCQRVGREYDKHGFALRDHGGL
jgi:hypothetical protein